MPDLEKYSKKILLWVLDLILGFIGWILLGEAVKLFENPSLGAESIKGVAGICAIIGATALTVYLLLNRKWEIPTIAMKKSSKEKEEVYKPLRRDVEKLIERVRMLDGVEPLEQPLTFWKETEGRISSNLYSKLENLFEKEFREYCDWLKTSKDFIRYKIYFYVNMHIKKLKEEYEGLGVGSFEYNLYSSLVIPVIRGDNISVTWFEEHNPNLWENIIKCPHSKDIRSLLEWLKERNPCIETLRKTQSDLIKLAENLRDELNRKIK